MKNKIQRLKIKATLKLDTFLILLFLIGIAGSAAAAEDDPDVEIPVVE